MSEKIVRKSRSRSLMAGALKESREGEKVSFAPAPGSATALPKKERTAESAKPDSKSVYTQTADAGDFLVPAWRIRSWKLKDRSIASLDGDPDFEDLKQSIRQVYESKVSPSGIVTPLLVRKLPSVDAQGHEYEEFGGFKRHTAAMQIDPNMPVPVRVMDISSDLVGIQLQVAENTGRSKPPMWDQAVLLKRVKDEFKFESRTDLAQETGYKRETCSNLIRIAEGMPADFRSSILLYRLSFHSLNALVKAVEDLEGDKYDEMVDRIVEAADEIGGRPERATKLIERIADGVRQGGSAPSKPKARKIVYESQNGKTFSAQHGEDKSVLTLHRAALDVVSPEEIENAISELIKMKGLEVQQSS